MDSGVVSLTDYLNEELGNDAKNLDRNIERLLDSLNGLRGTEHSSQDQSIYGESVCTSKDGEFRESLAAAVQSQTETSDILADAKEFHTRLDQHLDRAMPKVERLEESYNRLKELERVENYLNVIKSCHEISIKICQSIKEEDWSLSACHFCELSKMSVSLSESRCDNLRSFVNKSLIHWYCILKQQLSRDFSHILDWFGWPYLTTGTSQTVSKIKETKERQKGAAAKVMKLKGNTSAGEVSGEDMKNRLKSTFQQLIQLNLSNELKSLLEEESEESRGKKMLTEFSSIILPLRLMLEPLQKRFLFHFFGKRQTNNLEKPEWYLTQALTWIRDNTEFLHKYIQPLLDDSHLSHVSAEHQFIHGVVTMCREKLESDLALLLDDELTLSHTISEVLLFQTELNALPSGRTETAMLTVLCDEQCFTKWLDIEKKYATEKVESLLCSESAWQYRLSGGDGEGEDGDEEMKVGECVETFITMISLMTDRYKQIPYAEQRLQFISLQLELVDDLRVRILQLAKQEARSPLHSNYSTITNAVAYIHTTLCEWNEQPFYVQQLYYKHQFDKLHQALQESSSGREDPSPHLDGDSPLERGRERTHTSHSFSKVGDVEVGEGLFDDMIALYHHIREEMFHTLVMCVIYEVKAKSLAYKRDRWMSVPSHREFVGLSLSSTACPWLLVLKEHLQYLSEQLSTQLFSRAWQAVADHLNHFILEEVIHPNHFSEGGAAQLQFDMTRNLFPLFAQYTSSPANHFKDVKEACILLTLAKGSALLVKEALNTALYSVTMLSKSSGEGGSSSGTERSEAKTVLEEVGVYKLSLEESEKVLTLRTDLTIY